MSGGKRKRIHAQEASAGRDAFVAGGNQTFVNKYNPVVLIAVFATLAVVSASAGASVAYLTSRAPAKSSAAQSKGPSSPVTVAVRKDNYPCGNEWIVPKPLSMIPKTPADDSPGWRDWTSWVKEAGAVDGNSTRVTVVIQGRTGRSAYITEIRFSVKHLSPVRGVSVGPPCGGPVIGRYVAVDLDQVPPRITGSSSDPKAYIGSTSEQYKPLVLPYEVSDTDGLVLIVAGYAQEYDSIWSADIYWSSDGVNGIARIDDDGVPFDTSPAKYATKYVWEIK